MGGGKPKAPKYQAPPELPPPPPPPPPPPSESSIDVQQENDLLKKKAALRAGRQSTVLTQQVNASPSTGATVLG